MVTSEEHITIVLSQELLAKIDNLRNSLGVRSRGAVIEKILREVFLPDLEVEP